MSATPGPSPAQTTGPVARTLRGLVVGRMRWWVGWPAVVLGAAGLTLAWTNLTTLLRYERFKTSLTAETRAHVSELYWQALPAESLGLSAAGRTGPAFQLAFRLAYRTADGRDASVSFRGEPDTESVLPFGGYAFLEVPALEFRFPREYLARLKATQAVHWPFAYDPKAPPGSKTAWHSEYDLFWRRLDLPLSREAFLWRHAETPQGMALRYDPSDPSRALPAAFLQSELPPALRYGIVVFFLGFFSIWGLGLFAVGFGVLAQRLGRMARWALLVCVASTPLWAPFLVRIVKVVGGDESRLVELLLHEFTIQRFLGFHLPEELRQAEDMERVRYDWERSPHTAALRPFNLDRGGRVFTTDDAAYAALIDQLNAQASALGDADLLTFLSELRKEEHYGAELGEGFLETAKVASTDPKRHPSVRGAARTFLERTLGAMDFDPHAFACGERLRRVRALLVYPDREVTQRARSFVGDADKYEQRVRRVD